MSALSRTKVPLTDLERDASRREEIVAESLVPQRPTSNRLSWQGREKQGLANSSSAEMRWTVTEATDSFDLTVRLNEVAAMKGPLSTEERQALVRKHKTEQLEAAKQGRPIAENDEILQAASKLREYRAQHPSGSYGQPLHPSGSRVFSAVAELDRQSSLNDDIYRQAEALRTGKPRKIDESHHRASGGGGHFLDTCTLNRHADLNAAAIKHSQSHAILERDQRQRELEHLRAVKGAQTRIERIMEAERAFRPVTEKAKELASERIEREVARERQALEDVMVQNRALIEKTERLREKRQVERWRNPDSGM